MRFFLQNVQTGSGLSLLFSGYRGSVPGVKWSGRKVKQSPPSSAEVNEWSFTSAPPLCFHGVERQSFTFTLQGVHTFSKELSKVLNALENCSLLL